MAGIIKHSWIKRLGFVGYIIYGSNYSSFPYSCVIDLHFQSTKEEIQTAISTALEIGYRHFDCAYSYMNEGAIGEVLNEWITNGKVKREELFIVTKVHFSF